MEPIITSLLDSDVYNLTMMNAVRHVAPDAEVEYKFVCRTPGANGILLEYVAPRLREQIDQLCSLRFISDELAWLRSGIPCLPSSFVDFSLRGFSLQSSCVNHGMDEDGAFFLSVRGPWYDTILFPTPLLAIVEELYMQYQCVQHPEIPDHLSRNLDEKIEWLKIRLHVTDGGAFSRVLSLTDMGTRRRFSKKWHSMVVERLSEELGAVFAGTSNMWLARVLGIKAFGTMAHEWIQAFQGMTRFDLSQKCALNAWQRVYGGNLGIALSDTLGTDMFLEDFDAHLANAFTGVRHDSGDPLEWGEQMLEHYEKLGISSSTKTFVFSNSLDFLWMWKIYRYFLPHYHKFCDGEFPKCGFGIGTFLTNDSIINGKKHRLDIVIKLVSFDNHPVIKISNDPGKAICTSYEYEAYAREQIKRRKLFGLRRDLFNKDLNLK